MGSRHRALVLYAVAALAAILISLFGLTWFHMDVGLAQNVIGAEQLGMSGRLELSLRSVAVCAPGNHGMCLTMDLSNFTGPYPTLAAVTFWASIVLVAVVVFQVGRRVVTDRAGEEVTRIGCLAAIVSFVAAGLAGYMFAPESNAPGLATIHRTWAPALAMVGYGLAIQALRHAIAEHGLSGRVIPSAVARSLPRETGRIRPAVPARPAAVDSIPVAAAPEHAHHDPFAPPPEAVPDPFERAFEAVSAAPPVAQRHVRYAMARVHVGDAGLDGERDDGTSHRVAWPALVGVIARRLPDGAPYDGQIIVDVVSTAGATLRITAATAIDGEVFAGVGADRARAFVQVVAERCPTAKLDGGTRAFVAGGDALQFPDADVLAQHDARVG